MNTVRCPICERRMEGQDTARWPQFPFCSPRCRTIDLGRWLGEAYRIPAAAEGEEQAEEFADEKDIP
jgi:uncharacterized protein